MPSRGGRDIIDRARGLWDRVTGGDDDGPGFIQHQNAPRGSNHGFGGSRAAFREQQQADAGGPWRDSGARGGQQDGRGYGPRGGMQGEPRGGFISSPQQIRPYQGHGGAPHDSGSWMNGRPGGGMDYRDRGWDDVGDRGFDPARMGGSGHMGGIVENRGWGGGDDPRGDAARQGRGNMGQRHPDTGYQAGRYERDMGPRDGGFRAQNQGPRDGGLQGPRGGFAPRQGGGYGADFGPRGGRSAYDDGMRSGPRRHSGPDLDAFDSGLRAMYSGTYNEGGVLGQTSNQEFDVPDRSRQRPGGWQGQNNDRNRGRR